jgi:hypothetical protein
MKAYRGVQMELHALYFVALYQFKLQKFYVPIQRFIKLANVVDMAMDRNCPVPIQSRTHRPAAHQGIISFVEVSQGNPLLV